jgi:hypothetical protein
MTPTMPARTSSQNMDVEANTAPRCDHQNALAISIRRRPNRSARVVRNSDTTVSLTSQRQHQAD